MKKILKLFLVFVVAVLTFFYSSCEITNVDDDICQKKEPLINATFIVSTIIKYNDGSPYVGPIEFKIYKIYCDGTVNGQYVREGNTNENGYYSPNYIYTYKYDNLKDDVKFYFKETTTSDEYKVWFEYSYNDVKSKVSNTVNQTFEITLPWGPPPGN